MPRGWSSRREGAQGRRDAGEACGLLKLCVAQNSTKVTGAQPARLDCVEDAETSHAWEQLQANEPLWMRQSDVANEGYSGVDESLLIGMACAGNFQDAPCKISRATLQQYMALRETTTNLARRCPETFAEIAETKEAYKKFREQFCTCIEYGALEDLKSQNDIYYSTGESVSQR